MRDAKGEVAAIYAQLRRELGSVAEPVALHAPLPDLRGVVRAARASLSVVVICPFLTMCENRSHSITTTPDNPMSGSPAGGRLHRAAPCGGQAGRALRPRRPSSAARAVTPEV